MSTELRHQCLIYEGSPATQLSSLAMMIQQKLNDGYRCLYLNSAPMVTGLRSYLAAMGMDVAKEITKNRLVLSSDSATSSDGTFDAQLMLQKLEDALDQALADGFIGLWASGDIAWEFGSERNFFKILDYERRLEKLFQKRKEICGICQYHIDSLPKEIPNYALVTHQSIFINETLSYLNTHYSSQMAAKDIETNPDLAETIAKLKNKTS